MIGREADAELGNVIRRETARGKIFAGVRALGTPQLLLEEGAGTLMDVDKSAAQFCRSRLFRRGISHLRQRDVQLLGDSSHRLRKADVFDPLHESEDVAGGAAAEAVKELPRGVDRERRRLLVVEG